MSYDTEAPVSDIDIESLDISLDDAIPQERTFLGQIVIDQKQPGKYGPEWHLGVRPLTFTLNSESGVFHSNPKIKFSTKTGELITMGEFGRTLEAIRKVGGADVRGKKVGVGELCGLVFHFALRKLEYGKDKETGEVIAGKRDSLIAVRRATKEELAGLDLGTDAPTATTYSPEDVDLLLAAMSGKKVLEYTRSVGRNDTLSKELKQAIMNGDAASTLIQMGVAQLVDGVFQAAVAA